ncbi:MAG TPA: molybdopterin-dependent oxidoreductase [Terriglobia bacterium]|nr:molybdopterin-dependent oxidoreductase [Terriglobia bacterium]
MQRRDFLKVAAITGTAGALDSCGNPEHQLIRFIPEEDLVPGVAEYKPSICTMCPAGCGLMVKVMEGDAEVVRNGQLGLIKMALAKKLEGNPNHPINQGKLCPRGQAGLQVTYHPDRIRHPLKRTGPRGSGQFQEISWDEAIRTLVEQLNALQAAKQSMSFLSRPLKGQHRELAERFLELFGARAGAPIYFDLMDSAALRFANAYSFGAGQLPTYDLANSNYVISFGADFLGTWNSPVAQSVGFGVMRQGRAGRRGKFVQVESRMSLTGASADEWLPAKPGTEGALALGLAHVIMRDKLGRPQHASRAGELISRWGDGLPDFSPPKVEQITGVSAAKIERLAREMASHLPAVVVVGGAPLAATNAVFTALAANALNALLGSIEQPGGVYFTLRLPSWPDTWADIPGGFGSVALLDQLVYPLLQGKWDAAKILLLNDANPVFAMPPNLHVREALEKIPFIASFGSFIDDTSVLADLILPDHSPLESWVDDIPESGSIQGVVSVTPPALRPLHNTRAMPDVLLQLAPQIVGEFADMYRHRLPWASFDAMLAAQYSDLYSMKGSLKAANSEEFWKALRKQGVWSTSEGIPGREKGLATAPISKNPPRARPNFWWRTAQSMWPEDYEAMMAPRVKEFHGPEFDGAEKDFPFHFLPYASQMLFDGSLAHLPWMQETPDPISTAMWGTWVEINPKTATSLGIVQGDLLEVASQHGKIQAPALIYPGIAPDTVAMPVGQGHEHFTRYASGRGANPISILAPVTVPETGSLAWAATRVKITKAGKGKLVLFAGGLREHPLEEGQR